jgi:hypothetical protein
MLRLPGWDAKQFGNIKRLTFLLLMKERHPRLVRQGWRFLLTVSPSANPKVLLGSCQPMRAFYCIYGAATQPGICKSPLDIND